jgi:DNA polymerase III, beta subunit
MPETDTLERPAAAATGALRIDRDTLLTAITAVGQVVERRNTIPIMSNLLLRTEGDRLTILASDLDLWSQRTIPCDAKAHLATTVGSDQLKDAIRSLRPGAVDLSYAAGALTIKQGRSTRKLMTLSADDFPQARKIEQETTFAIDGTRLLTMLDSAKVSVSNEEIRYYLCGVFVHHRDGQLKAASTNGHTLSVVSIDCPVGAEGIPDSIIGTKAINLICSMLGDLDEGAQVELSLAPGRFHITDGKVNLGGKLVDGTYPQYERLVRASSDRDLTVHSGEFDRSIRAAGVASDGKTRGIRIDLAPNQCEASARAQDGAWSSEPIEGEYRGADLRIGVNLAYAQNIAKMFGSAVNLTLGFQGEKDPILITSDDRKGLTMVVMPMHA